MLIAAGMILVGFIALGVGAEFAVRSAVAMANKLHVPAMVISLTLVAFGTSIPEFMVCFRAAIRGATGISIGNVVGSNVANILLILAFAAMVHPMRCNVKNFIGDYLFLIFVTGLFIIFAWNGHVTKFEGLVLLFMLVIFLVRNYRHSKFSDVDIEGPEAGIERGWIQIFLMIVIGVTGIMYGSDWLIGGAVDMAKECGVSHDVIGLTVLAFGTALPELATTTMAALRRQYDVALGNVMGSNIWNIVFIMGTTSTMTDVAVPEKFLRFDMWVMLLASASLLPIMYRTGRFSRLDGLTFFFGYIVYMSVQWMIVSGNLEF